MYAVTVGTGGHIGIAICKGTAIRTVFVKFKGFSMTRGAGGRDLFAGGNGQLAAGFANDTALRVRVMTVRTERRIFIAFIHRSLMDAIVRGCILIFVAFLTGIGQRLIENRE